MKDLSHKDMMLLKRKINQLKEDLETKEKLKDLEDDTRPRD